MLQPRTSYPIYIQKMECIDADVEFIYLYIFFVASFYYSLSIKQCLATIIHNVVSCISCPNNRHTHTQKSYFRCFLFYFINAFRTQPNWIYLLNTFGVLLSLFYTTFFTFIFVYILHFTLSTITRWIDNLRFGRDFDINKRMFFWWKKRTFRFPFFCLKYFPGWFFVVVWYMYSQTFHVN